ELVDRLDRALIQAACDDRPLALVLVDLNHFNHVNDVLGYAAGDQLLRDVADRLRGCVGSDDIVARIGSDDFALVLRPSASTVDLTDRLANLVTQLLVPMSIEGYDTPVT